MSEWVDVTASVEFVPDDPRIPYHQRMYVNGTLVEDGLHYRLVKVTDPMGVSRPYFIVEKFEE